MEVSGTRSSWLTMPRNSPRNRSSPSVGDRSWKVTTTESISPLSDLVGVALTSVVTLLPSGTRMTSSSARTGVAVRSNSARGSSARACSPPVGPRHSHHVEQLLRGAARHAKVFENPAGLLVQGHRATGLGIEDHGPHGRGVDQGLQISPGSLLGPVPAGAGDRGRGLRREQHQHLFVLAGELSAADLVPETEVADMHSPMAHRHALEGPRPRLV